MFWYVLVVTVGSMALCFVRPRRLRGLMDRFDKVVFCSQRVRILASHPASRALHCRFYPGESSAQLAGFGLRVFTSTRRGVGLARYEVSKPHDQNGNHRRVHILQGLLWSFRGKLADSGKKPAVWQTGTCIPIRR